MLSGCLITTVAILFLCCSKALGSDLELTVLHVNDIHVRFEETNTYGGTCKSGNHCFGGLSRVYHKVKEIRSSKDEDNVIFLNGGDFYQGNIWYSHFKWRAVAHFGNILNFTAMALGNHEFDDRASGLLPLLEHATFPIICTNMDSSNEPLLNGKIPGSIVINVQNKSIGIIGYVIKETDSLSRPGKLLRFNDEVEAINKEANRLKYEGVDVLIALGHSGYEEDKRIAAGVPHIDLVVGGHSHSFLYSTRNGVNLPSRERPIGEYPTIVKQASGKSVPVVQAFAYTKYLGYLKLSIDENNRVVSWRGSPILLDESVPQDPGMLKELASWKKEIQTYAEKIIGQTSVLLLKSRVRETNLGDFITDGMLHHLQSTHDVFLALMNSGGIRGSFEVGDISREDLLTVIPFENLFNILQLRGKTLWKILERSVERMSSDGKTSGGGFLQASGFKMVYHLWKAPGSRLYSVLVRKGVNSSDYEPLRRDQLYSVAVPDYLTGGGDGYTLFKENEGITKDITPDHIVIGDYIALKSPINASSIADQGERIRLQVSSSSYFGASAQIGSLLSLTTILYIVTLIF